MLILGLLSVFQVTLLPGLLIIRLFKSKFGFIQKLSYIFMLSLLANYVGVFALTSLQLYRRSVSMGIFVLELAAFIWLYRSDFHFPFSEWIQQAAKYTLRTARNFRKAWQSFWAMLGRLAEGKPKAEDSLRALLISKLKAISVLVAVGSIAWMIYLLFANVGTVFNAWDAYATWEPWSMDWYLNRFARNTYEYPQLIPINWSITYRFTGSEVVKFFAKGMMPLFTLMTLLLIFDLGLRKKSFGYFLGVGISFYGIYEFMGKYIGEGYADLPVASLSFLVIYSLLVAQDVKDWQVLKETLLLGSLAAAAATVTKAPGAYMLVFFPILAYILILKNFKDAKRKEMWRWLIGNFLLSILIVAPWYVYAAGQIQSGDSLSAIPYVTEGIYAGANLWERLVASWIALKAFAYLLPFLLLALPFVEKSLRWIILTVILPYSVLWGMFLSYEYRNLAVAFPLIGMAAGVAIEGLIRKLDWNKAKRLIGTLLILLTLIWGISNFTGDYLVKLQNDRQRQIFEPAINIEIYTYFANQGPGVVLSSYPVGWLPGLQAYWENNPLNDFSEFQTILETRSDIQYLLISIQSNEAIWQDVSDKLESGDYEKIFSEADYTFFRLNR